MIVESVVGVVLVVGLPLLIVLFYFEGLIVGKVVQPPLVFVVVLAVTTPPLWIVALLLVGCTIAVTAGQWTAYLSFDDESNVPSWVPGSGSLGRRLVDGIAERPVERVGTLFERYGGIGIFLAVFLPGVRGMMAIPAGMTAYPVDRFLVVSLLGNAVYFSLLTVVAFWGSRLLAEWSVF